MSKMSHAALGRGSRLERAWILRLQFDPRCDGTVATAHPRGSGTLLSGSKNMQEDRAMDCQNKARERE